MRSSGRIVKKGRHSIILSEPRKKKIFDDFFAKDFEGYGDIVKNLRAFTQTVPKKQSKAFKLLKQYKDLYQLSHQEVEYLAQMGGLTKNLNFDGWYKKPKSRKKSK